MADYSRPRQTIADQVQGRRTGLSAKYGVKRLASMADYSRPRQTKTDQGRLYQTKTKAYYSRPTQTIAEQSILTFAVLPASPMPLFKDIRLESGMNI